MCRCKRTINIHERELQYCFFFFCKITVTECFFLIHSFIVIHILNQIPTYVYGCMTTWMTRLRCAFSHSPFIIFVHSELVESTLCVCVCAWSIIWDSIKTSKALNSFTSISDKWLLIYTRHNYWWWNSAATVTATYSLTTWRWSTVTVIMFVISTDIATATETQKWGIHFDFIR